jgi:DNA replication protein DnaC
MDVLISPICDIIKYLVEKHWIQTDDTKLNLILYTFSSIFISFVAKYILNLKIKELIDYLTWYVKFKILRKEVFIFPLICLTGSDFVYSPKEEENEKTEDGSNYAITLRKEDNDKFMLVINYLLREYFDSNRNLIEFARFSFEKCDKEKIDKPSANNILELKYIFNFNSNSQKQNDNLRFAYVDGYFVLIRKAFLEENVIRLECKNNRCLEKVIKYMKDTYDKFLAEKKSNSLEIFEFKHNAILPIGKVKEELTFDNYVSKHKQMIIKKLEALKNGNLYNNNPYIENNLGLLLYGNYGTGKSFLISAVANYMRRNVLNVDFTTIKTKEDFRRLFNEDNHEKYVYCFDEFDYLLDELLGETTNFEEENKSKIQILSTQISLLKDTNKEATEGLIKQMKDLMENNEKFTYSTFLSELSGLKSRKNCVIIATTNFIDKIPQALTRPGRFDFVLNLNFFDNDEIKELLIKLYKAENNEKQKILKSNFIENKFTPSQIILKSCEYEDVSDMIKFLS